MQNIKMDTQTERIYSTVYKNSIIFLKRGIKEIVKNNNERLENEQAIISCLFIQMSIELGLKAFLIKERGIKTILQDRYQEKTIENIFESFNSNTLHTKNYNELKNFIKNSEGLTWFNDEHFAHLDQFQLFRNKLVHLNLYLSEDELFDLKYELIYAIVHIIIPLLSELSFECASPTEFYSEHLDENEYKKLISFPPYIEEMEKIAKKFSGLAYECPECFNWTFSPNSEICYCCNLKFIDAGEYLNCKVCNGLKSVIFDKLNIEINGNTINGLCLKCGDKPMVFKCPECETQITYYGKSELENTCFLGCKNK